MYMKNNIILLAVATLALNSCGIYKKYEPVATLPENLYREEIARQIPSPSGYQLAGPVHRSGLAILDRTGISQ
mgnify:CR=1 FL=1